MEIRDNTEMRPEAGRASLGIRRQNFQPYWTPRDCWDMRMVSWNIIGGLFIMPSKESPVTLLLGAYM